MIFNIYPSGSICKSDQEKRHLWTDVERNIIRKELIPHTANFFDPNASIPNLSDAEAVFGRDIYQIKSANFVVVDGRDRRGLGVGVEMFAAKFYAIPLLVVCPFESHYRCNQLKYRGGIVADYIHPHIFALADAVVTTFEEAGQWIYRFIQSPFSLKDITTVDRAIQVYEYQLLYFDKQYHSML